MILEFRLNACPICLTCLDCENKYGQNCTCQARKIIWKKKKIERDYAVNFCRKALTQRGATSQKVALDSGFVDWFFNNISSSIELSLSSPPDDANVCQDCMNRYRNKDSKMKKKQPIQKLTTNNLVSEKENDHIDLTNTSEKENICIDLTSTPTALPTLRPSNDALSMTTSKLQYITLVCFDRFKQPRKKLDGAIDIPYNLDNLNTFGDIEEEILSRTLPIEWGKIELGLICYQKSFTIKADHFDLKSSGAVAAFVAECQKRKNIQLCVYSAKQAKRKELVCGSSVIEDDIEESVLKKIRTSESGSLLETTKLEIYRNLPKCEYHIQGCLIAEDGRHLKLNNDMITIWARAMIAKINGVDAIHPPSTNMFDKVKYRYPNSKKPLESNNINISINDPIPIEKIKESITLSKQIKPNLITVHLKKKSPYKSNIQVIKKMTFQDIIKFVFPMGPPDGKRFVI